MTVSPRPAIWDVAIVGLGPAGRALAHRATALGSTVVSVDPLPRRSWTATYAAWEDELPDWLPRDAVVTRTPRPTAWTTRRHTIDRTYCVLNTSVLQSILGSGCGTVLAGRAVDLSPTSVQLDDGSTLKAHVVVDARGTGDSPRPRPADGIRRRGRPDTAAHALAGEAAVFMDWRRDNGTSPSDAPSFLYGVPLAQDRFLLEETCLVGRPPHSRSRNSPPDSTTDSDSGASPCRPVRTSRGSDSPSSHHPRPAVPTARIRCASEPAPD